MVVIRSETCSLFVCLCFRIKKGVSEETAAEVQGGSKFDEFFTELAKRRLRMALLGAWFLLQRLKERDGRPFLASL